MRKIVSTYDTSRVLATEDACDDFVYAGFYKDNPHNIVVVGSLDDDNFFLSPLVATGEFNEDFDDIISNDLESLLEEVIKAGFEMYQFGDDTEFAKWILDRAMAVKEPYNHGLVNMEKLKSFIFLNSRKTGHYIEKITLVKETGNIIVRSYCGQEVVFSKAAWEDGSHHRGWLPSEHCTGLDVCISCRLTSRRAGWSVKAIKARIKLTEV